MSSLLDQAIIDAKLLKETARKNAEAAILEQYEPEIKKTIEALLEQDDMGLDLGAPPEGGDLGGDLGADSLSAPPPSLGAETLSKPEIKPSTKKVMDKMPASFLGEDNMQEIELNLESIIEKIDNLEKDLNLKAPDVSRPAHEMSNIPVAPEEGLSEGVEEEAYSIDEKSLEQEAVEEEGCQEEGCQEEEEGIKEEIHMDMEVVKPGGIQGNRKEFVLQQNVIDALEAQKDDLQEQLEQKMAELDEMENRTKDVLSKLQETREKLKKSVELNVKLKEGFEYLTKKVAEINVLNSRLLYTNKVLGNSSLNERQKKQIAESISSAKSVEEAKTIYETLQRSTEAVVERRAAPKSLVEAVNKMPPAFLPRVSQTINPEMDRWQRIAGIKK